MKYQDEQFIDTLNQEVMMSRKDYIKIAKVVHEHRRALEYDNYIDFVHDLCVIFEEDNDKFDSDKFCHAAGLL